MKTITSETLIARRVRGGGNEAESRTLLSELHGSHGGGNLEYALVYNGFASPRQAAQYVATLPLRHVECDCGDHLDWYRGDGDQACPGCGTWYNAFGQRLRSDWAGNPSNYDDEISDLDGYEIQHAGH